MPHTPSRRPVARPLAVVGVVALLLTAVPVALVAAPASAAMLTLFDDPLTDAVPAESWLAGDGACLTAGDDATSDIPGCADASDDTGDGMLRLTPASPFSTGFVIAQEPVDLSRGLQFDFDMYQYGGGGFGADGLAFFLIDGAASPSTAGAYGKALGYASSVEWDDSVNPGLEGGYAGVAFDAYGNFSHESTGTGGLETYENANRIVVRGSEESGYLYATSVEASGRLAVPEAGDREPAARHVTITISSRNVLQVWVDYGDGPVLELADVDLEAINGEGSLPEELKFGFSAGTGTYYDVHGIANVRVTTLAPNATVWASATAFDDARESTMTVKVSNPAPAGSTDGDIQLSVSVPARVEVLSASGEGWSCSASGATATCTRAGAGANALRAGGEAPPVTVRLRTTLTPPADVPLTARVTTADDSDASNDEARVILRLLADSSETLPPTGISLPFGALATAALALVAGAVLLPAARVSGARAARRG